MSILSCSVESCERKSVSRGWCDMHYRRWKRHGDPLAVKPGNGQWGERIPEVPAERQCSLDGCVSPMSSRGWCKKHYKRWERNGDPLKTVSRDDAAPCAFEGCEQTVRVAGYCYAHYSRKVRNGEPGAGRKPSESAVDHEDGSRTCNTCGVRRSIEAYHCGSLYKRGRSPKCRSCCAADRREWAEANQELLDERAKAYRHKRRAMLAKSGFAHGLTRAKIRSWQGDDCAYCGVEMDFNVRGRISPPRKATIDHIVPIARGGGHVPENVTLCCSRCNSSKGSKTLEEWKGADFAAPAHAPRYEQSALFALAS